MALRLVKVVTGDMHSDIFTKPVAPVAQFQRLARLILTGNGEGKMGGGAAAASEVN